MTTQTQPLIHPFPDAPAEGELVEITPGILWTRFALPFRLNHVNVYFLKDDDGWLIVDTGIDMPETRTAWRNLLSGALKGETITGLIVTHHHPDHIGLAGWLCDTLQIPLMTSQATFLATMTYFNSPELLAASIYTRFFVSHGMSREIAALVSVQGHEYMRMLSKPPFTYRRLAAGDVLKVGGRDFHVLSGDGHCPEQLMLHLPEENILLAADQVIEKISPNISVMAIEPDGNPLGAFIRSLSALAADLPAETLVLAGHRLPFLGLQQRCAELIAHHDHRCDLIREETAVQPMSAADLVPVLFRQELSPHEMSFAFSEVLAHMNYLAADGELVWQIDATGHRRLARP
ncbi:MBL fold metallo-hydrolase [Pseudodonghicola flavimaris]|uniref:MBL fold metallo-hydrolase n=1 Tax=Pseudodonghicola flavimaris TaxID=3050036 RepID=A0ABT7EUL2_9RHOB|nr:MBL fold metallo-hydrolase [Pseudodonghicola flavimaris]MDK3016045.1 MBL fold metallo-hydrolase [Pseudodonghicola flavimaris]